MSGMTSSITASSLQAGAQAQEIGALRGKVEAAEAEALRRQTGTTNLAGEAVGVEENDTAVFADAQGPGSEGRYLEDGDEDDSAEEESEADDGSEPAAEHEHLDIEA